MKSTAAAILALAATAHATVQGFDISNYQPNVNFAGAYSSGARFVIIKVSSTHPHLTGQPIAPY
jgi:GH25 family lysozyme M1 (1,4-beta-N-acetylmuramidase)